MLWEIGNLPKTQNVPETQAVIQRHFVICTVLLVAALQHSPQDCSLLLEDKMTQVPPLFHHYSLMKSLGLEDCHCRRGGGFINTSLQHHTHQTRGRKIRPNFRGRFSRV